MLNDTAPDPPEQEGIAPSDHPYEVLQNKNYLRYLLGRFIASMGGQMLAVAVGWELYEKTGSALKLGYVGLTQMIPMIGLTLLAGHVADNYSRKKVFFISEVIIALSCLGLCAASYLDWPLIYTYLFLFTAGSARTFLWPASSSLLPAIVPRKHFAQAVTWNSSSFQLSSVAGPALGGLLIALTKKPSVVYAIGFVTAITCGFLVASLSVVEREIVKEKLSIKSLLTGFSFVFKTRLLLGTITLDLFAVLLGGATTLLPAFAKDVLHVGPSGLGWLQGALPLGSFCMALHMAHRKPMQKAGRALLIAVAIFGLATIGFGFSKLFVLSFLCLAVCGAADNISIVVRHTLVQLLTPDDKRGRVSAVNSLFIGTSNELGGFESGLVAHYFGLVPAVVAGGVGTIIVAIVIAGVWPEVRKYGSLTSSSK